MVGELYLGRVSIIRAYITDGCARPGCQLTNKRRHAEQS